MLNFMMIYCFMTLQVISNVSSHLNTDCNGVFFSVFGKHLKLWHDLNRHLELDKKGLFYCLYY